MTPAPLRNIVIAGGGLAAWMTAAALARALRGRASAVRVIETESDDWEAAGAAETSIPPIRMFHAIVGIDEDDLIRATRATFKLGVEFQGWGGGGYIHPYGAFGVDMDSVAFHQYWLRQRSAGETARLEDYSLSASAARIGRFARPAADPNSVLSTLAYALHLDAGLYADYLRSFAEARGVRRSRGKIADVFLNGESGFIEAVGLADGERVGGDLFIDCTGSQGRLIGQMPEAGFEDWSEWLACDRALLSLGQAADPAPLTRVTAHRAGWRAHIPLQDGAGGAFVYSSAQLSDDQAADELDCGPKGPAPLRRGDATAPEPARSKPRLVRFRQGRRRQMWVRNCVAIGAAAGFIEPLESTNLHIIQNGVVKFAGLLPERDCPPALATEYNRLVSTSLDRLRDLAILHYKTMAGALDTDFWRSRRAMSVPDQLAYKMRLFAARGKVVLEEEETFEEPSWIAAFIGQGVVPGRTDPRVDMADAERVRTSLARMRTMIREAANSMPMHPAYVARICAASRANASGPRG